VTPELAIVIVGMNTREWVRGSLSSLRAHGEIALEIVVVDNCSEDGSCEMIESEFPEVKLVRNTALYGFAQNNNIGAAQTSAPLLLFLNPDTEVPAGSLRAMLDVIAREKGCGIFGGKLFDADGEVERSVGRYPTLTSLFCDRLLSACSPLRPLLDRFSQRHYLHYERERPVQWTTGAYLWIRRSVLDELGGWDGEIFMYGEDADLCYRSWRAGYATLYAPSSTAFHYHNKTPIDRTRRKRLLREGLTLYAKKHYGALRYQLYRLVFAIFW
jgi:GT2 family glycosyltransferase